MSKRFKDVETTVATLEVAAARVVRFKKNAQISSYHTPTLAQVHALVNLFKRMKINRFVTAKVGSWRKMILLVDVIVNYDDAQTRCRTGAEAHELSQLMLRAMHAVRTIIETNMPGVTGYCPSHGITDGFYRFQ